MAVIILARLRCRRKEFRWQHQGVGGHLDAVTVTREFLIPSSSFLFYPKKNNKCVTAVTT
jgi:hypothetical protein